MGVPPLHSPAGLMTDQAPVKLLSSVDHYSSRELPSPLTGGCAELGELRRVGRNLFDYVGQFLPRARARRAIPSRRPRQPPAVRPRGLRQQVGREPSTATPQSGALGARLKLKGASLGANDDLVEAMLGAAKYRAEELLLSTAKLTPCANENDFQQA